MALGGQGPAHVIAEEAQLHQSTGEATFRGHARLWQQANSVSGPLIVLDRQKQTLVANTKDPADPVKTVLLSAGATAGKAAAQPSGQSGGGNTAGKTATPSVIRVRGGDLWYSDTERRAVMHGGVLGAVVAETGTATSTSNEVELRLTPAGNRDEQQWRAGPGGPHDGNGPRNADLAGPAWNRGATGVLGRYRGLRADRHRFHTAENDGSRAGQRERRGFDFP